MSATEKNLVVLDNKKAPSKKKAGSGAAKMREAADKAIAKHCEPIAEALAKNSKKGQMLSAKFLYELARKAEETGEGKSAQTFRSMAFELANSPEWKGDSVGEEEEEA